MDKMLLLTLDAGIIVSAAASGCFWYLASKSRLRRISRSEELDSRDLNRIIVALNRNQILNRRAALATALAGILAAVRFSLDAM